MRYPLSRREFLKDTVLTAAALSTSAPLDLLAASRKTFERIGPPKKVVVMGAGLAGLSAAFELTQAGHDVTILEAQMRPGGRVLTLRQPFSDGLYAEAGAARVPDSHDLTLKYAKLFNLTLDAYQRYASELARVVYHHERRFTVQPDEDFNLLAHFPLDLTLEERELGFDGLWQKYLRPVIEEMGDRHSPDWPPQSAKKYDQMTVEELMREQGASPGVVTAINFALDRHCEDRRPSALWALAGWYNDTGPEQMYKIRGGTDLLPNAFAARLAEKIHYGSPVVRIEHDTRSVRVFFLQAGAHQTIAGDYLICAIPFSVLRDIEISPPFTPEKQRAVTELTFTPAARVFLQFRRRYWLEEGFSGFAETDVLQSIWNPTFDQPGPRGILLSFLWDSLARHLTAMTEDERINYTLKHMEKIFPGIRQHFEGGVTKSWGDDPWARGCSVYLKPGQVTSLLPYIARHEGRVHFAGTHTYPQEAGWMQGAFVSGNRAAREVNEAP
ncbi:MAG: FAD-dependent oxidoreductase [Pseudomonadota bacterium]